MGTEGANLMFTSSRFYLAKDIPNLPVMVKMEIDNLDPTAIYNDFKIKLFKRNESKGVIGSILEGIAEKSIFYVPTGCTLRINLEDMLEIVDSQSDVIATLPLIDEENLLYPRISIGGGVIKQPQIDPDSGLLFDISKPVDGNITDDETEENPSIPTGMKRVLFDVKYGNQSIQNSVITLGTVTNPLGQYLFKGVQESESVSCKIVTNDYHTLETTVDTRAQIELVAIPFVDYYLNVTPAQITTNNLSDSEYSIQVDSNLTWEVTAAPWLTVLSQTPMDGSGELTFKIGAVTTDYSSWVTQEDAQFAIASGFENDYIHALSRDHNIMIVGDQMRTTLKVLKRTYGVFQPTSNFDIPISGTVNELILSPTGNFLAVLYHDGIDDNRLMIYKFFINEIDPGLCMYTKLPDPGQYNTINLKFSNDGLTLAGVSNGNVICIYQYTEFMGYESFGRVSESNLTFNPDADIINIAISGDATKIVGIYEDPLSTGEKKIYILEKQGGDYYIISSDNDVETGPGLALSKNGSLLVCASLDYILLYQFYQNAYQVKVALDTEGPITSVDNIYFSQDDKFLTIIGLDEIKVFGKYEDFQDAVDESGFIFDVATQTITGYKGLTEVVIPDTLLGVDVLHIAPNAFDGMGITSLTFNTKLNTIGDYAFYLHFISYLEFPENVTQIGHKAFDVGCYQVKLHQNINMFHDSLSHGLGSVYNDWDKMPGTYQTVENGKILYSVDPTIPDSTISLSNYARYFGCKYEKVVKYSPIGPKSVDVPDNVWSSTGSVYVIASGAFSNKSLLSVNLSNSAITIIEENAFDNNPQLTSFTLKADMTVNNLGSDAHLVSLTTLYNSNGKLAGTYTWDGTSWNLA